MSVFKKLFQQTFIYGLATVLPRALAIVLVPLYTSVLPPASFGVYATLMSYIILGNVLLSYGIETAFFRFINKSGHNKKTVQSTALSSLTVTSLLFLTITLIGRETIATLIEFDTQFVTYALLILTLDALVILPFAWFRANEKPMQYAVVKILNVCINLGANLFFFLLLPKLIEPQGDSFWNAIYLEENKVIYVFVANVIASAATLLMVSPVIVKIKFGFDAQLWKQMMRYALPVLIAGIAFSINEAFDKILLKYMLPADVAESEVGVYAACYKLGVFMTLFATAFRLGIEPFFFNHAKNENAKQTYATITKYFTIFGSIILLVVVVYIDFFKEILITNSEYWVALGIVPIILLANLCLGIYHNLSVWYKVTDRTHFGAYISIVGATITLALNYLLIPIWSYMGSAIATLAAYGTMMLLSYFFGRRYYAVPYDLQKMLGYLVLAVIFGSISFYGFDHQMIYGSAFLLVFLLLVFLSEKKELLRIVKR